MFTVELLIFDLDGTLCDTKDDIANSVNMTLKDLGLPQKPKELIYTYVGSGVRQLLQQAVEEDTGERFVEALQIFRNHYTEHLLDTTRPYPGMEAVLKHFEGKQKAVVTNKPQGYAEPILEGLNLTRYFDLIVGGENGLPLKPDSGMIVHVLERLKAGKNHSVIIGDGLNDIGAARASGIRCCAVGYGLSDPQVLKEAEPDFFCESPQELKCLFE